MIFLYLFDPFSDEKLEGNKGEEEGKKERNCFSTNVKFNLTKAHHIFLFS